MYMRSYEDEKIPVPESYGGTAFNGTKEAPEEQAAETVASVRNSDLVGQLFSPVLKLFGKEKLSMPHIGTEEIILIAAAAFLLFGKEHDFESALLLIFLVFIS